MKAINSLAPYAHWLLRLTIASVFIYHGILKLENITGFAQMMSLSNPVAVLVALAEVAGVLAIVSSLLFVGIQINQSKQLGYSNVLSNWSDRSANYRFLIAENAEIWWKACAGEELRPEEKVIAQLMYTSYTTFEYTNWVLDQKGFGDSKSDGSEAVYRYAANWWRYPGFRDLERASTEWGELGEDHSAQEQIESFGQQVAARIAELSELEPEPDFDVSLCGTT